MSYGTYILRTGLGDVGKIEELLGRHYYKADFGDLGRVLDLGPGRCWFTRQNPSCIIAVDLSPEIVAHYAGEGLHIQLGSAYDIPFPDNSFDGVFSCWLFEHLTDVDRAMQEVLRVLRPGGKCLIIVPSPQLRNFWDDYTHVRPFTHYSLHQLAENNGFTCITTRNMPLVRGLRFVIHLLGMGTAARWISFAEGPLRAFGISNRGNVELRCLKPQ